MTKTLSFSESTKGWTSFWSYHPSFAFSLKGEYYTIKGSLLWRHYDETTPKNRGMFYGEYYDSTVDIVLNQEASMPKVFKTLNYEGTNGWEAISILSDAYSPNNNSANHISIRDSAKSVKSYSEGKYMYRGVPYWSGFKRKENKYFVNLKNDGVILREGEVIHGEQVSGIKGVVITISLSTDKTTDVGGDKKLFAVSSEVAISSR